MHVLQLANFYGPRTGGLRVALDQLGCGYVAAGHRRTLVVPGAESGRTVAGRSTTVRIRAPLIPGGGGYRLIIDRRVVRDLIDMCAPDVIELSDKTTLLGPAKHARRGGIPVVLFSHERLDAVVANACSTAGMERPIAHLVNRHLLRHVDAVVCASQFAADEFTGIEGPPPLHRVPLGVDLDTFAPPSHSTDTARGEPVAIVSAVRLSPEKRPGILVETSRELQRRGVAHTLTVFGDGPLRAQLTARSAGLPVEFRGHVTDRTELAAAMGPARVAIAPGPAETFGLAALEMLACGLPVVVPARGSLPEVVGGAGVAVEPSATAFADAVMLLHAGDRDAQRIAARARAEAFTWERAVAGMLAVFDDAIGSRDGREPEARASQPAAARSNL